ncbi:MAG TPA: response regulator [Gemmatimonadales bacterium]|nr:response regulator [Gemmatimonadales bacterium]
MVLATTARPVVLVAAVHQRSLPGLAADERYATVQVYSGTLALRWTRDLRPDLIVLDLELPDMSGMEVCRLLHADPRIGHYVPILLLVGGPPTPEQRVAALRAGAWDFICHPPDPDDLSLKVQTYVQAKRNIDRALGDGLADAGLGVHTPPALARRARELGALMARKHGALACVVLSLESDATDGTAGGMVVRASRLSDVVGALSPTEFAVLAPGTDHGGALNLARRLGAVLRGAVVGGTPVVPGKTLRAGYDAVTNLTYAPIDPVDLLLRARAAVRHGKPEPAEPWVRRFEAPAAEAAAPPRGTPPGLVLDQRRISL